MLAVSKSEGEEIDPPPEPPEGAQVKQHFDLSPEKLVFSLLGPRV